MNKSRMIFVATCIVATMTFFTLYAFVLVPVVFPVKERIPTIFISNAPPENRELLEILKFPSDSWVFEQPDMFSFSDGAGSVLCKDYEFLENNQVKVSPCVVLWFPNNHQELSPQEKYRQAIVLEAANYALLELDGPIGGVMESRSPQLLRGELNGLVTIRSDMKNPDASDDIKLETSDVLFDFNRIQTRKEVYFQFGSNQGRGRDLTIHMANTDESKKAEMPNTIKKIELRQLEELRLYVENEALNYSAGANPAVSTPYRHIAAYPQSTLLAAYPQSTLLAAYPQSTLPAADPQAPFRSDCFDCNPNRRPPCRRGARRIELPRKTRPKRHRHDPPRRPSPRHPTCPKSSSNAKDWIRSSSWSPMPTLRGNGC